MPGLRDVLQGCHGQLGLRPPSEPTRLVAVKQEIEQRLAGVPTRPPADDLLAATHAKLRVLVAAGGGAGGGGDGYDLSGLSRAELKRVPWVLFEARVPETEPLAANKELVKGILRALIDRGSAAAVSAMMAAFLWAYPDQLPFFQPLRRVLAGHLLPAAKGARNARWHACEVRCGLLAEDAPVRLAARLSGGVEDPGQILDDCGLTGMLASGALVERAYVAWIRMVREGLASGRQAQVSLDRLIAFSRHPEDASGLRHYKYRVPLADGLLLPFAERPADPLQAEAIKGFLLDVLGDPRLTGARRWARIDDRARQVMYQWLVTTTLQDFFRLLEYAAESDQTAARHWRARKAFWSRYLKAGHIRDAWVALGPVTQIDAHQFLSAESRTYAVLDRGASVLANHSVIIMRIGDLIVTEWSHSGKFRAWREGNGRQPSLYEGRYTRETLIDFPDEEVIHHGGWEGKISDVIYKYTGIHA